MIKNYFKIAWRNLSKNNHSSIINITGLAVGMATAIVIGLWVYEEFSFNKYHQNYNSIAQVMQHQNFDGDVHTDKAIPVALGTEMRRNYGSDFTQVVLSSWTNPHLLAFGEKSVSQQGNFMEAGAPDMLTLKMVSGSKNDLSNPSAILISQSVSKALFADENAIGKTIKLDTSLLKVTGVYEDLPANTTFSNLGFIAPWQLYASTEETKNSATDWNANLFQLFVQVANGRSMSGISSKIKDIKLKALGDEGAKLKPQVFLQPMSHWHLYGEFQNGVNAGGAIQYVWMCGIIGFFVLLLACINFMNLSTARSERRAKEVGVRKAIGSMRSQLIGQFYCESLLIAFFSFIVSLVIVLFMLSFFNSIADKKMTILWSNPFFWLISLGFTLITGLIAGSYPALYLSSFKPVSVLKGTFKAGRFSAMPRKALVITQFTVSIILIIGTVIVYKQVQFAKDRSVGYNRERLMLMRPYSSDYHDHFQAMKNDLIQTGMVTGIAESSNAITRDSRTSGGLTWQGKDPGMQDEFTTVGVTTDYGKTVGWQFIEGRDFSNRFSADSSALVINEAAAKYMRLQHPVGATVTWDKTYTIIGVIKNVVMTSPYEPVKQALYFISPEAGYLNIRINDKANISEAITGIENICKKYSPAATFDFKFADEEYARKFSDEQRIGNLATVFAILAIFISCLGLFGLASFVAEQRTKEIGVRKILGASVFNLWRLQSKEFVMLVVISLLIATPAAYYFTHNWLQNYQYHTEISLWLFVATGAGTILIVLLTISYQSIKAAIANPVKSLRTE